MRAAIHLIDRILRTSGGVIEYTEDTECILRVATKRANHTVNLGSEMIFKGDLVLEIHAWNEHMPKISAEGANLEWALRIRRQVVRSFKELAKVMQKDKRYSQVRAVCGASALLSFTEHTGGVRMMQHLGFSVYPIHNPLGKFGEFWENLFSWWLIWAYNESSLHSRQFRKLQRTEIWITIDEFLKRYGESI